MKYRIRLMNGKYRAEIGKENNFGRIVWDGIENDNGDLCDRTRLYDTIEEAKDACKFHHTKCGYDSIDDIVEEFEL